MNAGQLLNDAKVSYQVTVRDQYEYYSIANRRHFDVAWATLRNAGLTVTGSKIDKMIRVTVNK